MADNFVETSDPEHLGLLHTEEYDDGIEYRIQSEVIVSHVPRSAKNNVTGGVPLPQIGDGVTSYPLPCHVNVSGNTPSWFIDLTNAGPWMLATLRTDDVVQLARVFPLRAENFRIADFISLDIQGQLRPSDIIVTKDYVTLAKSHQLYVVDKAKLQDYIQLLTFKLVSEVLNVDDVVSVVFVGNENPTEVISTSDSAYLSQTFNQVVVDALNLIDFVGFIRGFLTKESMSVGDVISQTAKILTDLIETMLLGDDVFTTRHILFSLSEDLDIEDTASIHARLWEYLTDRIITSGTLSFDSSGTGSDENYTFVMNTVTKGISEYTNYKFNSLSGDYAAKDEGIYQISGIQDEGIGIEALLKTGLIDFDSNIQKQVPYAYVGLNKAGSLMLKTIVTYKGKRKERWYKVNPRAVDATDTIRVNMGKGIKSRYWQFELTNFEGADFELDSIELLPLQLKRRI